jgi:hypothetical protein
VGDVEEVLRERPRVAVEDLRIGGEAGRAFDVAVLRHHAFQHHQRRGAEFETVAAEQRRLDDIARRLVRTGAAQLHLLADAVGAECLMHLGNADLGGAAGIFQAGDGGSPVPPVLPATLMTSAPALATPTAMVPMPSEETSLTMTRTRAALQSWMSWARSSIE